MSNSSAQALVATINTVTSVSSTAKNHTGGRSNLALCLLPFSLLWLRRTRSTLLIALFAAGTLFISACGSGGNVVISNADPNLRYTPPGTYQHQVTATSTTGAQLSQSVILNLTVAAK